MKVAAAIAFVLLLFACKREDKPAPVAGNELWGKKWYVSKWREVRQDSLLNTISDTTRYPVQCANDWYLMNQDSTAMVYRECVLPAPHNGSGRWYQRQDSLLLYVEHHRISYGTGYVIINAGIHTSKIIEQKPATFSTYSEGPWLFSWPGAAFKERTVVYTTYVTR